MQEILSREMIGLRIRSLRTQNAFSQETASRFLGISRGNYSQIELGNQYPTYEILFRLSVFYNKSYLWFLHGQDQEVAILPAYTLPPPVECTASEAVCLVKDADYYSYLSCNRRRDFIDQLESLNFLTGRQPAVQHGIIYRAFEVADCGMVGVVNKGDIITAQNVRSSSEILLNGIYVLVSREEILIRRIVNYTNDTDMLVCKADNPTYPLSFIRLGELQDLWHMGGIFSTKLKGIVEEIGQQLKAFENSIAALKENVESLRKKNLISEGEAKRLKR